MKRCHPVIALLQGLRVDKNALYALLNTDEATFRAWEQGNALPSLHQAQIAVFCAKFPEVIERFAYVARWAKGQGLLPTPPQAERSESNASFPAPIIGPPVLPLPAWMEPAPSGLPSQEEKRKRIIALRQQHPEWSAREIARYIGGTSNGTVSRVRRELNLPDRSCRALRKDTP